MRRTIDWRKGIITTTLGAFVLTGVAVALNGCDAVAGAGQDISAGGQALTNKAEQVKSQP
jgi:entericidin B